MNLNTLTRYFYYFFLLHIFQFCGTEGLKVFDKHYNIINVAVSSEIVSDHKVT